MAKHKTIYATKKEVSGYSGKYYSKGNKVYQLVDVMDFSLSWDGVVGRSETGYIEVEIPKLPTDANIIVEGE